MVRTQDSFDGRRVMAGHRLLSVRSERLLNYINAHLKEVDINRYMYIDMDIDRYRRYDKEV